MLRNRIFSVALWSVLVTCSAQDSKLTGPIAGLVFDQPSRSLRRVVGMPGAALLDRVILSDLDWASVAPSGRLAIFVRQGEARLYSATDQSETLIQGAVISPLHAAWSPDSSAVAIYSASPSSVQWLRISPQGTVADPATPLLWQDDAVVTGFAADAESRLAVLAVAGQGVFGLNTSQKPALIAPLVDISALALEPGGHTLWLADRPTAQLLQIQEPASSSEAQSAVTDPDRLADVSAIAFSSDRKQLYIASRSTHRLYTWDRAAASLSEGVELFATATALTPLGRPSLFLLGQRAALGESLYLFDEGAGPAIYFVPAKEEE